MLVPLVLFGWIPAVLLLFAVLPSRRAVIVAFLAAWLFLPVAGYQIAGLPDYTKMSATCVGVLLAVVLFDAGRIREFRPCWIDSFMAIWCVAPMAASMANGLGVYDGASGFLQQTITWGIPYFIGRLYFTDIQALRELALGFIIGGLIYMPLCLWEIRMSPQLHATFYGFAPTSWVTIARYGGYRPVVFMKTGLAVGLFMAMASLIATWMWRSGKLRQLYGIPMVCLVPPLLLTTFLCKSMGATGLLLGGLGVLYAARFSRRTVVAGALVLVPLIYIAVRATGLSSGRELVSLAAVVNEQRADSLQFRLDNEEVLAAHALRRPVFGWGGWGRNRPADTKRGIGTITDGLWIIAFGAYGVVGLTSVYGWLLVPSLVMWRRYPPTMWSQPTMAAPVALSMLLTLYAIDNLFNNMPNPIFVLVAGAISGFLVARPARQLLPKRGVVILPRVGGREQHVTR